MTCFCQKNSVLFLFFLMLLYGCDRNCIKIPLSQIDKSWLNFALLNDTISFSNKNGYLDTFVVVRKDIFWGDCNRFELGLGQREIGEIVLRKVEKGNLKVYNGSYRLSFNGAYSNDTVVKSSKYFAVLDLETDYFRDWNEISDTSIFLPALDRSMKALFVKVGNNSRKIRDVFPKIDEFYWNKDLGLVAYKKESGEMFYYHYKW